MAILYIAGSQPGVGKTALATALASRMAQEGRSVALVKPLRTADGPQGDITPNLDSAFYQQTLPANPPPQGWPVPISVAGLSQHGEVIEQAAALVRGLGVENAIVEGLDGLTPESPEAQASAELAQALGAQVLALAAYPASGESAGLAEVAQTFGASLLGLVINGVPQHRAHEVATHLAPDLEAGGVRVLGAVPEDRRMLAPTVRDLAEHLEGEFRSVEERADELVEYLMVGGWFLDPGDYVFSRRAQKAVLVNAERPDLQMAALNTSTVCLILTGGQNPIQYVTHHAELAEVPIVLVQRPTLEAMEQLHTVSERVTVHNPRKVARFGELLAQHCDLEALYAGLGLTS